MRREESVAWRERLSGILSELEEMDCSELPELLGELARLDAAARLRLANGSAPPVERYLKADEVAERLSVSSKWVYEHQQELGAVKLGGALRFPEARVRRWLDARRRA